MPTIKQIINIIEKTPTSQAILLEGIHGIGKSDVVESHFTKKGYRMVTLFLGQMADAGDLIGLPDREKSEETGYTHTVFRPPFWWPKYEGEKFILFLDELNRGKPEVMQCIMDMVLHRKLMGKLLPEGCIIIGAMNPLSDDGYYQVDELDPALIDRFNVYPFRPDHEEWLDWAMKERLHSTVIGFIVKNVDMLDPITSVKDGAKKNDIQPSRRSWERVSGLLKKNEDIEKNDDEIQTFLPGMVGINATSRFRRYVKDQRKGLSANSVIMKWTKEIESKIKKYDLSDILHMNKQIAYWFEQYEKELINAKDMQVKAMKSLAKYLDIIGNEPMAQFLNILAVDNSKQKSYARTIMRLDKNLGDKFFQTLSDLDDEDEEKELEDNIGDIEESNSF